MRLDMMVSILSISNSHFGDHIIHRRCSTPK